MRPSRVQTFMEIADVIARRATCYRLNVGAVAVSGGRIVCTGYNGTPPGAAHCTGNSCPGRDRCSLTIHAEANAINYARGLGVSIEELYCTHSPCQVCAELIVDAGITRVFYRIPYRVTSAADWLAERVSLYQVMPAGYIIDHTTREILDAQ